MRHLTWLPVLALVLTACGGGATGPTPVPVGTNAVSPPAGVTTWAFGYRPASSHTCPGPVATPDDGGLVSMTMAPDGRTLSLVGLSETTITIPTITNDGGGTWVWQEAGPAAGSYLRISFRFLTPLHAEGEIQAVKTILADASGGTCSATWPILLDRQG